MFTATLHPSPLLSWPISQVMTKCWLVGFVLSVVRNLVKTFGDMLKIRLVALWLTSCAFFASFSFHVSISLMH